MLQPLSRPHGYTLLERDERDAAVATKPLTYYADAQDTPEWRVRRTMLGMRFLDNGRHLTLPAIGGSSVAKFMLSAYSDGEPSELYAVSRGEKDGSDPNNVYTRYGKRYEARVRAIFESITGRCDRRAGTFSKTLTVEETGLYRMRDRTNVGVSLDGITREAVRLRGYTDDTPLGTTAFDWHLGQCLVEIKTSFKLKPAPMVSYVLQTHLQMMTRGRLYTFLVYWSADAVRIWLIRRDEALCRWMLRRIDLASMHVCRGIPLSDSSPFLPWVRYKPMRFYSGATWADYVQWQWFGTGTTMKSADDKPGKPPNTEHRPPLVYDYWADELQRMRIYSGSRPSPDDCAQQQQPQAVDLENDTLFWSDDVPGGAETDWYAGETESYLPSCPPDIYLIYEYTRTVPPDEIDTSVVLEDPVKSHDIYLKDHDTADLLWFAQRFPSIPAYARHCLKTEVYDYNLRPDEDGCLHYTKEYELYASQAGPGGHGHIKRLFVTEIDAEQPSDAVCAEQIGTSASDDSPAEQREFAARVQQLKLEMAQQAAAPASDKPAPSAVAEAGYYSSYPPAPSKKKAAASAGDKKRRPAASKSETSQKKKSTTSSYSIDLFLKQQPRGAVFANKGPVPLE